MKVKVNEISGEVLNRLVHKSIDAEPLKERCTAPPYSSDWCFGGPIIERHIFRLEDGDGVEDWPEKWVAEGGGSVQYGPTALIAVMRAYVASKLGEEVDVPEEIA